MNSSERFFYDAARDQYFDPSRGPLGRLVSAEQVEACKAADSISELFRHATTNYHALIDPATEYRKLQSCPEWSPGIRLQWYLKYSTNEYMERFRDLDSRQAESVLNELRACE